MSSSLQGLHSIGKRAWRTISLVCVGTAAKPALSIVEGAVLSSTARHVRVRARLHRLRKNAAQEQSRESDQAAIRGRVARRKQQENSERDVNAEHHLQDFFLTQFHQ